MDLNLGEREDSGRGQHIPRMNTGRGVRKSKTCLGDRKEPRLAGARQFLGGKVGKTGPNEKARRDQPQNPP